ncbi:hypothetical protein [Gracilibacillus sp. YIM 98692]|nr:hypothetical protein [Gracilibacillus sp. YIM 98692]
MNEKESTEKKQTVEIEQKPIREIDHETRHPDQDQTNLVSFDDGCR